MKVRHDSTSVAKQRMDLANDLLAAIDALEARALAAHAAGACRLSRWSCSYCEASAR